MPRPLVSKHQPPVPVHPIGDAAKLKETYGKHFLGSERSHRSALRARLKDGLEEHWGDMPPFGKGLQLAIIKLAQMGALLERARHAGEVSRRNCAGIQDDTLVGGRRWDRIA